jgi:hypothetical protein
MGAVGYREAGELQYVRGTHCHALARLADLMSGFYRQTADLLINCPLCYWEGWVPAIEDYERMSVTWDCPECGHHEEEDMGNDDD